MRVVGFLILGAIAAILLFVGVLGTGDKGVFAGAGFFGPIALVFKFLFPFIFVFGVLAMLLTIPRK